MKYLSLSIILTGLIFSSNAQNVNIPDANFKTYLLANASINTDVDPTEISVVEASAFTGTINCSNLSITNLTGIEAFTALTELYCGGNTLSGLDVSQNTALTYLNCQTATLNSLDVSQNTALTYLNCSYNPIGAIDLTYNTVLATLWCNNCSLSTLDVAQNIALITLWCQANSIVSLSLSSNIALTTLWCHNNSLVSLDVSQNVSLENLLCDNNSLTTLLTSNPVLTNIKCNNNSLTTLDVSQNGLLDYLNCAFNSINTLDLTQNTALNLLACGYNSITSLDVSQNTALTFLNCSSNQLNTLDVANGSNANITAFYADGNTNLTCITVDDVNYSTTNWTNIDAGTSFSTNCPACTITIPDANFKAYLVGNTLINTNGNTEIECSEASTFTGDINCTNQSISDLTGLEAFTALDQLFCNSNALSTIDVTANTLLTRLDFNNNNVSTIDLSANNLLKSLNSQSNQLQSLNLSANIDLEQVDIRNNPVTSLDIVNNVALIDLNCRNTSISSLNTASNVNLAYLVCDQNSINSLDFSSNINLLEIFCNDNLLTSLNLANGNNSSVNYLDATNNSNLTCIQVDDVAYSTTNWMQIDPSSSFSTDCSVIVLINSITVQGQAGVSTITTQGGTLQIEADVLPANADDGTYTWSVFNQTGSATIDANGLLTASTNGIVSVTATANDASGETGSMIVTISNQDLGINENAVNALVKLYPNPVQNELFVESKDEQITEMTILDYSGRVVKVITNTNANSIDVSELNQGVYLLKVSTGNGVSTKRFIKQ
ncbi:MAG: Leucine-rich repeat (LRR) protein [Salibacteraceae bacterium]|jgi:Leucine-rich repeat (LRR) protein